VARLGVAPPVLPEVEVQRHRGWLARGYGAEMGYLARKPEARYDATSLLPDCRSVIAIAVDYYVPGEQPAVPAEVKWSRYAWGDDYHAVVQDKLAAIRGWLLQRIPDLSSKITVDTSPLTEKAFAVAAGLGWQGRNSIVLNDSGSYFFLGLLLTSAKLPLDHPVPDGCGTCTACIQACPTGALVGPGMLDSRRCVSYLTTERREPVLETEALNGWLYGCDTCQEVCPYNAEPRQSGELRFQPRPEIRGLTAAEAADMSEEHFEKLFACTAVRRRKVFRLNSQGRNLVAAGYH
jgi:epoxyqueuosine reductase